MSKNTNLSFLTDYITADITNGRIGINNASPTVAFDVSGATKISGALTLTGALSGTSATFSSSVTVNGGLIAGAVNGNIRIKGSTDGFLGAGESDNKLYLTDWTSAAKGLIILLTTGAATFSNNVTIGSTLSNSLSVGLTQPTTDTLNQIFAGQGAFGAQAAGGETDIGNNWYYYSGFKYRITAPSSNIKLNSDVISFERAVSGTANAAISFSESMRIQSSGNVAIGTTADDYKFEVSSTSTNYTAMFRNTSNTTCNGVYVYFSNSTSGTSQAFYRGESGAGLKAMIYTNGSYGSATGTYGSIVSDIRLKENISDATSKLDDILKLRVVNFNITADLDKKKQIGFIAQEFKEVFPSLVFETDTREYDKNGNLIKGLENAMGLSVGMEFAILTKAIQELSAENTALKNRIEVLENK